MEVCNCYRSGCENIMCSLYSSEYGYICEECFEELVALGPNANIRKFMNTERSIKDLEEARAKYSLVFHTIAF